MVVTQIRPVLSRTPAIRVELSRSEGLYTRVVAFHSQLSPGIGPASNHREATVLVCIGPAVLGAGQRGPPGRAGYTSGSYCCPQASASSFVPRLSYAVARRRTPFGVVAWPGGRCGCEFGPQTCSGRHGGRCENKSRQEQSEEPERGRKLDMLVRFNLCEADSFLQELAGNVLFSK